MTPLPGGQFGKRRRERALRWTTLAVGLLLGVAALGGCKKKVTQAECDQLLDHFAELVVKERLPDAGPEAIKAERVRERQEATRADEFKNCTSEVQVNEHACALKAQTSDGILKCLE